MSSRLLQALELACGPAVQDLLQHNAPSAGRLAPAAPVYLGRASGAQP